jgi:uncharacterized membrane protein
MQAVLFKRIFWVIVWAAIILLSGYFFMDNVIAYFYGYRSRTWGNSLFNNQLWVSMHMLGGTFALVLGPMQFWPFLRNRYMGLHGVSGKIYMAGIALIGLSAGRLSFISSCVPCRISLFLLTVFTVLSTFFAWIAIKQRNIKVHRQMMVRSYICVLAFVFVRVNDIISLDFLFGTIEDNTFRRVVQEYFWSFVPLIFAEIIMVWWPSVSYVFKKKQNITTKNKDA